MVCSIIQWNNWALLFGWKFKSALVFGDIAQLPTKLLDSFNKKLFEYLAHLGKMDLYIWATTIPTIKSGSNNVIIDFYFWSKLKQQVYTENFNKDLKRFKNKNY